MDKPQHSLMKLASMKGSRRKKKQRKKKPIESMNSRGEHNRSGSSVCTDHSTSEIRSVGSSRTAYTIRSMLTPRLRGKEGSGRRRAQTKHVLPSLPPSLRPGSRANRSQTKLVIKHPMDLRNEAASQERQKIEDEQLALLFPDNESVEDEIEVEDDDFSDIVSLTDEQKETMKNNLSTTTSDKKKGDYIKGARLYQSIMSLATDTVSLEQIRHIETNPECYQGKNIKSLPKPTPLRRPKKPAGKPIDNVTHPPQPKVEPVIPPRNKINKCEKEQDIKPKKVIKSAKESRQKLNVISGSLEGFGRAGGIKANKFLKEKRFVEFDEWSVKYDTKAREYRFYNKITKEYVDDKPDSYTGSVWVQNFSIQQGKKVWLNVITKEERDTKARPESYEV